MKSNVRSTLTFSQPVLEVGVTPPFPVEINAVTDEQGAADPGGYRARSSAHHNSGSGGVSAAELALIKRGLISRTGFSKGMSAQRSQGRKDPGGPRLSTGLAVRPFA